MTVEVKINPSKLAEICSLSTNRDCLAPCYNCPKVVGDMFVYRGPVEVKASDLSPVKPRRVNKSEEDKKPVG